MKADAIRFATKSGNEDRFTPGRKGDGVDSEGIQKAKITENPKSKQRGTSIGRGPAKRQS